MGVTCYVLFSLFFYGARCVPAYSEYRAQGLALSICYLKENGKKKRCGDPLAVSFVESGHAPLTPLYVLLGGLPFDQQPDDRDRERNDEQDHEVARRYPELVADEGDEIVARETSD